VTQWSLVLHDIIGDPFLQRARHTAFVNGEEKPLLADRRCGLSSTCRSGTERRTRGTSIKNLLKIAHMVPEISCQTDRQTRQTHTDKQTYSSQYFATAPAGEVITSLIVNFRILISDNYKCSQQPSLRFSAVSTAFPHVTSGLEKKQSPRSRKSTYQTPKSYTHLPIKTTSRATIKWINNTQHRWR